jgi:hypothetical protein
VGTNYTPQGLPALLLELIEAPDVPERLKARLRLEFDGKSSGTVGADAPLTNRSNSTVIF